MANQSIRRYAKSRGVFFWEIALFLGVSENTITRKLRTELSEDDAAKFKYAIDQISKQKESSL